MRLVPSLSRGEPFPTIDPLTAADVSPDFVGSTRRERRLILRIIAVQQTPKAIRRFAACCDEFSDYSYWYLLGSLWVSYAGWSDLSLWRKLFTSDRPNRDTSLMKPSELFQFEQLRDRFTALRAHRPNEKDWLSYTLDPQRAAAFAVKRGMDVVKAYEIDKLDVLALFTRRGEAEILILDPVRAHFLHDVRVMVRPPVSGEAMP